MVIVINLSSVTELYSIYSDLQVMFITFSVSFLDKQTQGEQADLNYDASQMGARPKVKLQQRSTDGKCLISCIKNVYIDCKMQF